MNFTEAIKTCFSKYAVFRGRAQRSEFWWFFLFSVVSSAIVGIVPVIGQLYSLVLVIPSLAVSARRLHDIGRSAWWLLLHLVSFLTLAAGLVALVVVGFASGSSDAGDVVVSLSVIAIVSFLIALGCLIALLVFFALPGAVGTNRYGPDPLHPELGEGSVGEAGHYSAPLDPMSQPAPEGTLFCSQCGTRLPGDAGFCPDCGTAI